MNAVKIAPTVLLDLALGAPCFAHHGVAPHYDVGEPVTIDGVVSRFEFINPHSFVYVTARDDSGAEQVWRCELASRSVLVRNGLTAESFKVGEHVTLQGVAARHNPTGCALRVARFTDGTVLEASTLFGPTLAAAAEASEEAGSIFGTWTMKRFSVSTYEGQLTPQGERARSAFDPVKDDPAIYCDPASPVRFWINVNEPFKIRHEDDTVVIDNRFMDSRRIVHLDAGAPGPEVPRSTMGYSTGRFEGDALVVTTSRFSAGVLEPRYGVLHSENLALTERLEVNRATGELEISWTIDDPAFFKEPVAQKELFVPSTWQPEPYDCKPGYQQ